MPQRKKRRPGVLARCRPWDIVPARRRFVEEIANLYSLIKVRDAEGATRPESLRQKDRGMFTTLESFRYREPSVRGTPKGLKLSG